MKNIWPLGRGHFWPKGYNLNKLGRGPLGDATYHISMVLGQVVSDMFFFHIFPIKAYVKHKTPAANIFGPRAIILTNMVEVD